MIRAALIALALVGLAACNQAAVAQPAPATATSASTAPPGQTMTDVPLDKGLPVMVRPGLVFGDVEGIDENAQQFAGTVDIRLQWQDLRLRYPAEEAPVGFKEYRGDAATARMAEIWSPDVGIGNMVGDPTAESRSLRMYPDGRVELMRRVTGLFKSPLDVSRFPFDRQNLVVELVSRRESADKMVFDFRQDDLTFSRPDPSVKADGWDVGLVSLTRDPLAGWYGETYSRLRVALEMQRRPADTIPGLFIPLFASLLIPLLATWLNRAKAGEFQTEAFELTNIVIGGLFAVIALNFTVNTDRAILATGNNTVSLLFGLNYLTLAISLLVNVALFRFNVVRAVAGRHMQHEVFLYLTWALPLIVASTAAALMLSAAV